jgi:putative ATP-dependent endonuclease of OLD family
MWIRRLRIENFRGIKSAEVDLGERQTVLVGSTGAGKSTILEALALLFGRDRLVRTLTEHDFYGSNPAAADRIRLIATITGFSSNVAADHGQWMSDRRGVPKWLQTTTGKLLPEAQSEDDPLCFQIAFCARFDRGDLSVETIRYFHDDDSIIDPFDEEVVQSVPPRLLGEIGFFLIPAYRTWDKLVSFNSELFRRILDGGGALEAAEVLAERDRLRGDEHRVDRQGSLKDLCDGINAELKQLVSGDPGLELRLTGTDSESLLYALIPHYRYGTSVSLPAGRHGSGLLSLQTALLVLQIAQRRRKGNTNVIIAVEEPELHMPPGVQAQVLHRLRNASNQLVCTTHSPRVAAVCSALDIRVVNAAATVAPPMAPLLKAPLPSSAKNGIRKLFHENRQAFVEAMMHRFVLVPEGRTDAEWLRLLSLCAITDQELGACADLLPFGAVFGVVPTHDACVIETIEKIKDIRGDVVALVDGDTAGNDYTKALLKAPRPPEHVVQWPDGLIMEDVVGWILEADNKMATVIQAEMPAAPASIPGIITWIKTATKDKGAKTDYLAHDAITTAILGSEAAKARTRKVLNALVGVTATKNAAELAKIDQVRSTSSTTVWRIALEP